MKISYDRKIKKDLSDLKQIRKRYGSLARKIISVMDILESVENLSQVPNCPPYSRHKLSGKYEGCWGIKLNENYRFIIKAVEDHEDLKLITEIIILDIVDYH